MTTLIPISFKSLIAAGLSSFIISATAIIPHTLSSCIKRSGVFPSSASFSALFPNSSDTSACSLINLKLPPVILFPLCDAVRPFPGSTLNSSKASAFIFLHSASLTIAFANGCSLFISREYASLNKVSSSYSLIGIISVTLGSPFVIVPVLSSATIFILPVSSSETAVLNKIPFFAPTPFPTIIATGVASPSAQGQLITSTEIPLASA